MSKINCPTGASDHYLTVHLPVPNIQCQFIACCHVLCKVFKTKQSQSHVNMKIEANEGDVKLNRQMLIS